MYDNGQVVKAQDLESLLEQERLLRPASEIDSLIYRNHADGDELLKAILRSKKDYVVDFRIIHEPDPDIGNELESTSNRRRHYERFVCKGYKKALQIPRAIS